MLIILINFRIITDKYLILKKIIIDLFKKITISHFIFFILNLLLHLNFYKEIINIYLTK